MDGNGPDLFLLTFKDDLAEGPLSEDPGVEGSFTHAPAAPEVPKAIGYAIVAAFGLAMLIFMLSFSGSGQSRFMTAISLIYLTVYLAVPAIFFRIHPKAKHQVTWSDFERDGLHTWTGHLTAKEATIQILTIPMALISAAVALGVAWTCSH
jgi:hypothetical protein